MDALGDIDPAIAFEIFTTVPRWFFEDSLSNPFTYHPMVTDIGLAQTTPFNEDLNGTLKRLDGFFPLDRDRIDSLARLLSKRKCRLILCDISPMGIAVGKAAGIPSVLVENFTWDWIYDAYTDLDRRFQFHIEYLKEMVKGADYLIQTEPVCCYRDADLSTPPVSRKPRALPEDTRGNLKIPEGSPVILITMGGIHRQYDLQNILMKQKTMTFVISGGNQSFRRMGNVVVLPHQSGFYHPDLIHASDGVIGKAGYSTLAEVYESGAPFVFVKRPAFRECDIIDAYVKAHMVGVGITLDQFERGDWLSDLTDLLHTRRHRRKGETGARQAAAFIDSLLK
jgi:hypothetical protein